MKKIYNVALIIAVAMGITVSIHAQEGPGFEIINKDSRDIWVAVEVNGKPITTGAEKVAKGGKIAKKIDLNANIGIGIYYAQPFILKVGKQEQPFSIKSSDFTCSYYISAKDAAGKTKYLTWNPAKYNNKLKDLYPQTGTFLGLSGKSDSGYKLDKNVKAEDVGYVSQW